LSPPALAHPRQSLGAALAGGRLQQIVDRVHFEGLDGIAIVRGHEDHRRHVLGADGTQHTEAVQLGHLHVQEHQVGPPFADQAHGLGAIARFGHGSDRGLLLQQELHAFACQRFVVDDQYIHGHIHFVSRKGRTRVTTAPPSAGDSVFSSASAP
jgi:hypothetical protein